MCLEVNIKCNKKNTKMNILRDEDRDGGVKINNAYFKINELSSLLEQYVLSAYYNKSINNLTINIKER